MNYRYTIEYIVWLTSFNSFFYTFVRYWWCCCCSVSFDCSMFTWIGVCSGSKHWAIAFFGLYPTVYNRNDLSCVQVIFSCSIKSMSKCCDGGSNSLWDMVDFVFDLMCARVCLCKCVSCCYELWQAASEAWANSMELLGWAVFRLLYAKQNAEKTHTHTFSRHTKKRII